MVEIAAYASQWEEQVKQLKVRAEQQAFTVSDIALALQEIKPNELPHVVLHEEQVVGFFLLDAAYHRSYSFCPNTGWGIRSLLIDQRFQGQGIAKKALQQLPQFVKRHYQGVEQLMLTVNCRNVAAYSCYLKSGFVDTKELYLGGPVGPQHIMRCLV
ncbi:GNAT family N-acetyltransferase [Vibrio sp. SCSIO 43135]|uniref:GNAT family N-acetyltransferase n=1 Tax=Vibrio sp. SCSIO 43135 TaxID=2819096 RepID=UPI0020759D0F|nr:GNAT family N-acetyltransferase [Vibrio sp. SCSIO 43135]USD43427.1 GNAT family N-acetyltransferase [Vibrio sp. SCSIO 43135]